MEVALVNSSEYELKKKNHINECIDTFFDAFEKRTMPREPFLSPTYGDPNLEPLLRSVDRRSITPDFVDEMNLYPDDWMAFMTNEGRLHYLPVVMSLSLQDLCDTGERYGVLDISIYSKLSPWPFESSPHEWKEGLLQEKKYLGSYVRTHTDWLFDDDFYFRHGGGNLLLSLEPQEKHALKVYVSHCTDTCSQHPLFVYGIYETLEGRIDVGDGYSWLPKHEKIAVVDFIDFLTVEFRDRLSEEDVNRMLKVRDSIEIS